LTVTPNVYDLFSSVDLEKIPDFEIQNGKLTVYAEQPFYVDNNFVIDTTENVELGEIKNGRWYKRLDMQSEEYHFFARSKSSQMECLDQFLNESLNYVRTIGR